MNFFVRFLKNESGTTTLEYGLVTLLVSIAGIGALELLGDNLEMTFNALQANLDSAATSPDDMDSDGADG